MGTLGIIGRGYVPEPPGGDVGPLTPEPMVPGTESTDSGANCYNLTPFPRTHTHFLGTGDSEHLGGLGNDSVQSSDSNEDGFVGFEGDE